MTRNTRSRASMTNKKNDESVLRQKNLKNSNEFIHTQIKDTSPPPALGSFMLRMFALFSSYSCVRNGTATRCTRTYNKPARHPRNAGRNRKVIITVNINIFHSPCVVRLLGLFKKHIAQVFELCACLASMTEEGTVHDISRLFFVSEKWFSTNLEQGMYEAPIVKQQFIRYGLCSRFIFNVIILG